MKRAIVVLLGMAGLLYPASALAHSHGAVFTLSNASGGNRVIAFHRDTDGHLGPYVVEYGVLSFPLFLVTELLGATLAAHETP